MPGTLRGTLSPVDADVSGGAVLDMVKFHYVSQSEITREFNYMAESSTTGLSNEISRKGSYP